MLTVLDIFSGIGGFSLGLESTGGFKTKAFCEINPFCRQVLAKHWPDVPIHEDVTKLRGDDVGPVDVICGGFPCQDISNAGKGAGIEGTRSGLWREYARLIGEIRPRFVIVENVSALLGRGLDRVLGDLASLGFDAEWHCIPASAVGAPHRRDRVWIVAYPNDGIGIKYSSAQNGRDIYQPICELVPNPPPMQRPTQQRGEPDGDHAGAGDVADDDGKRCWQLQEHTSDAWRPRYGAALAGCLADGADDQWRAEPDVGRVAHGVPMRVDRLGSLGNAVVPQVVEGIGNAILEAA